MKFLLLYFAAACVAVNVASTATAGTADAIQARAAARSARLCPVNPVYCLR